MKMLKYIQTWLLIMLLALSASGVANAKLASGGINLNAGMHQCINVANFLNALGIDEVSRMLTSESPLATKSAARLCFVEGTPVHIKDGLKPIEEVEVGDLVASKNDTTGEVEWKPVVELFRNNDKEVLNVSFASISGKLETLGVTAEHPFWVGGKGWTNAGDLNVGDDITTLENGVVKVATIASDAKTHTTYNFEVEDFHTYFVGESALWVHNQCNAIYKTTKEAKQAAENLGFKKINETIHGGQAVFKKGKRFLTRDVDGHNGGAWKMAKSVKGLGSRDTRLGTFDKSLNRIGD